MVVNKLRDRYRVDLVGLQAVLRGQLCATDATVAGHAQRARPRGASP